MPAMLDQLLADAKAAILKRNPGLKQYIQPGLAADVIRKDLKRAGIQGNVDQVVAVFSHFNGASCRAECEASRLGFAPPIVKTIQLPPETLRMLESVGKKVDPSRTIYGTFYFPRWEGVTYGLKTWRKFASNPRNGVLLGRVVPLFVYGETHQELAFDTDPSANGRILSIQTDKMKAVPPLTLQYASLEEFLRHLIEANQDNRHLAWPAKLGPAVELPMPAMPPKAATKSKKVALPATKRVLLVRADFSNDAAWRSLQANMGKESDEFELVGNAATAGLNAKQLLKQIPEGYGHSIAVLADERTFASKEPTLLVVDLQDEPGQSFRTLAACLHEVYDNLSVANMEFAEFIKAAKASDGMYRGSEE
jgi:hypothetical protein